MSSSRRRILSVSAYFLGYLVGAPGFGPGTSCAQGRFKNPNEACCLAIPLTKPQLPGARNGGLQHLRPPPSTTDCAVPIYPTTDSRLSEGRIGLNVPTPPWLWTLDRHTDRAKPS